MKILLLHQYYLRDNEGGGSRFNQFVKYWEKKGHYITVVAGTTHYSTGQKNDKYKGKWVVKEQESEKVDVYRTYVSEAYNKNFVGRLWGYLSFTISSLWTILFKIKKHDVMIVTSPPLFLGITGILATKFKRMPLLFEVRDLWPESAIDTGVLKSKFLIKFAFFIEKLTYKHAKKINVLTPAFRKTLVEKKEIEYGKITYIPNGADLDIFIPTKKNNWVREKYNLTDKFVITYMGAHGVANGLTNLLKVAEEVKKYKDIVFMFIGDGMEKEMLLRYSQEGNLTNVLFIPTQPKKSVSDFCNASDVCTAILKKVDTFKTVYPNKVFDYMSCSKPILLGIDGVARDLVEKSNSGYYVDPENPIQFKEQLLSLYNNKQLIEELGRNGYEFVKENFSRDKLAEQFEKELLNLVWRKK